MINVTQTQARILIYLDTVSDIHKNVTSISNKLGTDYSYIMRVLQQMVFKGWVFKHPLGRKMFYDLTKDAPVDEAKRVYLDCDALQSSLNGYTTPLSD